MKNRRLTALMIELTNTCNAKCPLCPTGAGSLGRDKGFISKKLFHKIMNEVRDLNHKLHLTSFNYGEPFLHPQWFDLYDMIPNNVFHKTSTNGFVFYRQDEIDMLAKSRLNECVVSIDGSTNELNSVYRVGVDLDKIHQGLNYFFKKYGKQANRPKIKIQTILFPYNRNDLNNIKSKFTNLYDEIYFKLPNFNMTTFKETQDINMQTKQSVTEHIPNCCSIFAKSFVINWNGECNPCCHDYRGEVIIGDVNNQTITEVFNSKKSNDFYENIILNRHKNDICRVCPVDRRTMSKNNIITY